MNTKFTQPQAGRCARLHFETLILIAGLTMSLLARPALSDPALRPVLPAGGNNWIPSSDGVPRALSTQDLNSGLTPSDLVTALLGPGVTVSNVTFTGVNNSAGTFTGGTGIVDFASGIMLSSGDISFVIGPNMQDSTSGVNLGIGDPELDALIPGYITYDACILEFDFQCTGTQIIQFQYVFTSEEYNEWVNTAFNDVFGFFLNGVNIALVPGSAGTPVSINNLNCGNPFNPPGGSFCNLFINNRCADIPPGVFPCSGARDTEMDGLTVVLTATGTLSPGVNHIKLAIADAGDQVLDSNVFIQGQSFTCGTPTGACCDTTAMSCTENAAEANCVGPGKIWSVGLRCDQLDPPCTSTPAPDGSSCSNPIVVTAIPFVDTNTTTNKGNDYSDTCLGQYDNGNDIVYRLDIGSAQCIDITVTGAQAGDNWIGLAVDDVCPPSAACLAQGSSQGTVATITNLALTPGIYYLMVDRWPLVSEGMDFSLTITSCGGAATGACCNALTQVCTDNVLEINCQAAGDAWSAGLGCNQLNPPCSPEIDPIGQDCEFRLQVTSLPFDDINTTSDKKEDYSTSCLGPYDDGDDVIYELTLTSAHCVDITVSGATAIDNSIGVVLDDACPPGPACLAQATTPGTVAAINHLALEAGTYYLMIDRLPDDGYAILDYRLTIADCAATVGACCLPDGTCAELTELDCTVVNGVDWMIGSPCTPNPCAYEKGDVNCDQQVDMADIPHFVSALLDEFTGCDITLADMDDSSAADGADVQAFVNRVLLGI